MPTAEASRSRKRDVIALIGAGLLPVPWMVLHNFHGFPIAPETIAVLSGLAILGGAFLLSWATEVAERDIPQALAILVLALVSVLPEYAVDLHFAWTAGKDPSYAAYAIANMTGANRLLIGIGWAVVVLIYCWRARKPDLLIHRRQRLEVRFLLWATLYSFFIPLSGTVNLFDAAVLLVIFFFYAFSAMRSDSEEVHLVGPAAFLDREFGDVGRRATHAARRGVPDLLVPRRRGEHRPRGERVQDAVGLPRRCPRAFLIHELGNRTAFCCGTVLLHKN